MTLMEAISILKPLELQLNGAPKTVSYFDVVGQPRWDLEDVLFFCCRDSGDSGWYREPFDRSRCLTRRLLKSHPSWVYVTEPGQLRRLSASNYVVVESVDRCLDRLCTAIRRRYNGFVVAVTGSVGKGTTCRLIESILSRLGPTEIIPARRLTPLIVQDYFLNRLDKSLHFLVVEAGLYMPHHVSKLAYLTAPDYGVLINAYDVHTGWNGLTGVSDVARAKAAIFDSAVGGAVNRKFAHYINPDRRLSISTFSSCGRQDADIYVASKNRDFLGVNTRRFGYTISRRFCTTVFSDQILCSIAVAEHVGIRGAELQEIFDSHVDVENVFALGRSVSGKTLLVIDRHSSYGGYFQALGEHDYTCSAIAIASMAFVDEDRDETIRGLASTRNRFERMLVHQSLRGLIGEIADVDYFSTIEEAMQIWHAFDVVILHDPNGILCE